MKVIPLTKGKYAIVDDIDYERASAYKWHAHCNRSLSYASSRKQGLLHRFILRLSDPRIQVDHRDGDGLNNTRNNLRIASGTQNQGNVRKRYGTSSKFKGVYWNKQAKKWYAQIGHNGSRRSLGCFNTEWDAAVAYDRAAVMKFGAYAKLNMLYG